MKNIQDKTQKSSFEHAQGEHAQGEHAQTKTNVQNQDVLQGKKNHEQGEQGEQGERQEDAAASIQGALEKVEEEKYL